ncbi:MAG: YncE family protein [Nitrososphaeraceae archaeon]
MNNPFIFYLVIFLTITFIFYLTVNNLFFDNTFNIYAEKFFGNVSNNRIDYPFQLEYPDGWKPVGHNLGVTFYSNETSESWSPSYTYPDRFDVSYFKKGETTIKESITNNLAAFQAVRDNKDKPLIMRINETQVNPNFKLLMGVAFQFIDPEFNFPIYSLGLYSILDNSDIVVFNYYSITKEFTKYSEFLEFVGSYKSKKAFKDKVIHGFKVSNNPYGFAINTATNTLYIANSEDNSVSVIDGNGNQEIKVLDVGKYPFEIAIDEVANKIYVLNYNGSSISVIDGKDNSIENTINVSSYPTDIAVNENLNQIYVAHSQINNITIINSQNGDKKELSIGPVTDDSGIGISVDELENKIYVTNPAEDRIDIIDPTNLTNIVSLPPDFREPTDIIVDPILKKAYVVDFIYRDLLAIDISDNKTIYKIPTYANANLTPMDVEFNPVNHKIYVSNTESDTLTELNPFDFSVTNSLETDHFPIDVEVNWKNNIIYITNQKSKTISMIDGEHFHNLIGIKVNIHPSNGGEFVCGTKKIEIQTFETIKYNSECIITPNNEFTFSQINFRSQTQNETLLSKGKSFDIASILPIKATNKLNLTEHGTYDIYFNETRFPLEYFLPIYAAIIAFFLPGIIRYVSNYFRKIKFKEKIRNYKINEILGSKDNREQYLRNINEIRKKVRNDFYNGKINDNEYKILLDDLSSLEKDSEHIK